MYVFIIAGKRVLTWSIPPFGGHGGLPPKHIYVCVCACVCVCVCVCVHQKKDEATFPKFVDFHCFQYDNVTFKILCRDAAAFNDLRLDKFDLSEKSSFGLQWGPTR